MGTKWILALLLILPNLASATEQSAPPDASTIINACRSQVGTDLTCRKFVEFADNSQAFLEHTIDAIGISEYKQPLGTVLAIATSRKAALPVQKTALGDVGLSYSLDTGVVFVNFGTKF